MPRLRSGSALAACKQFSSPPYAPHHHGRGHAHKGGVQTKSAVHARLGGHEHQSSSEGFRGSRLRPCRYHESVPPLHAFLAIRVPPPQDRLSARSRFEEIPQVRKAVVEGALLRPHVSALQVCQLDLSQHPTPPGLHLPRRIREDPLLDGKVSPGCPAASEHTPVSCLNQNCGGGLQLIVFISYNFTVAEKSQPAAHQPCGISSPCPLD